MLKSATPDLFSASELSIVQGRIEPAFREETCVITRLYDTASIQEDDLISKFRAAWDAYFSCESCALSHAGARIRCIPSLSIL